MAPADLTANLAECSATEFGVDQGTGPGRCAGRGNAFPIQPRLRRTGVWALRVQDRERDGEDSGASPGCRSGPPEIEGFREEPGWFPMDGDGFPRRSLRYNRR